MGSAESDDPGIGAGLRHVLVFATPNGVFPPQAGSLDDLKLLRMANRALQRSAKGTTDAFLLLFGKGSPEHHRRCLDAYGFPAATVMTIDDACLEESTYDDCAAAIGQKIKQWLAADHPGAIAYVPSDYDPDDFWWMGIEVSDTLADWSFSPGDFAEILPAEHRACAETWLAILNEASDVAGMQATAHEEVGRHKASLLAATLGEWLHGFEAVSGNGWNHFEPQDVIQALGISPFALGYEAGRIRESEIEEFSDSEDAGLDELTAAALKSVTAELRPQMRGSLSDFFGGDSVLFYVLQSRLWPHFDRPMLEKMSELVNPDCVDEAMERMEPWMFVIHGWHESADP